MTNQLACFTAEEAKVFTLGTLKNSWSVIFRDSDWKFCEVIYPVGTWHSDEDISDFFSFFFLNEKKKTCWRYKNNVFANRENYKMKWKVCLGFIIDI